MKIDLHLHTKKCKQGDGSKRNITPKDFVIKMRENDVRICAITNHNHFDIQAYEEIIKEDEELVVFPGIELDIKMNNEQYHIIVVCNPEKRELFYQTFDGELERDYDSYYLEYNDFIDKVNSFESEDIIVIPHFLDKEKKRSLNKKAKEKLSSDLKEHLIILEPGKFQTMGVINAHNELSLIGSDVKDWRNYEQYEIPEIKFKISSFKMFYELAKHPSVFVNTYLKETDKYLIPVKANGKKLDKNIEIYRDINIVFGEKGSGKTILLKDYIHPYFKGKGFNVFLHEGKDYDKQYENLIKNFTDSVEKNERVLNIIEKEFKSLINYNESAPLNYIEKFKRYHSNINANKNAKIIKKINSKFSSNYTDTFESIVRNLELDSQKIEEVKKINETIREDTEKEKELLRDKLQALKNDLKNFAIREYKNVFINDSVEYFLTALKSSVHKKTGKESKPNNIGFAKLVSNRLDRIKANSVLRKELENIKSKKSRKLGYIPNKGEVNLVISIEVLQPNEKFNERNLFEKNKIRRNRSLIEKIEDFNIKKFRQINDYFDSDEKVSSEEFSYDVIKKKSVIGIAGNDDYTPSEGEKAIITVSALLENDNYDCYLFDEIERGLGQKYITDYIVPKLKEQRDKGKIVIVSTHNSNIAINTLPSQTIYCDYNVSTNNIYYSGNLYTNELTGIEEANQLIWKEKALIHLEGSEEMFGKRRNIYGI